MAAVRDTPVPLPEASIRVGGMDRSYLYHIPARLPRRAPLLLIFHGVGMSGQSMRAATGYEFERLADRDGFVVIYPNGYKHSWNDCRRGIPLAAKEEKVDDVAFTRALISHFQTKYDTSPSHVYAMGFSNGGHFAYRLAVELADRVSAVAIVSANLTTKEASVCRPQGQPIAVLIMNGTADSINPYDGGIANFGANLRSARATAEYFAKLNGQTSAPRIERQVASGRTAFERTVWNDPGKPKVVLIKINGGRHVVPLSASLDGPTEIWDFFVPTNVLTLQ